MSRLLAASAALVALLASADAAYAQPGPPGRGGGGAPTQSSPTRSRSVGPMQRGDDDAVAPSPRAQGPSVQPPADPLAVPPEVSETVGSDYDGRPPGAVGGVERSYVPTYQERRGDYRLRLVPPLYLEHTRGLPLEGAAPGGAEATDTESLIGMLYYRRRSPKRDADVLFPLAWRVRDDKSHVLVLGPIAHREAPNEHDNWLAPLVFQGKRADGGYFHSPLLLTTSKWSEKSAFTISGPYFRTRTGSDVTWGVAPLVMRGDNGDVDGGRRTFTLIPPLLYYHHEREIEESKLTVVGPVIRKTDPKRSVFDIAPLFFSIHGKPQTGGVAESHYTLFPFFHYGRSPDQNLFIIPGYLRRVTPTVDTLMTPVVTHSTTRSGATSLLAVGPLAPMFMRYSDRDTGLRWSMLAPLYFSSTSPEGRGFLTPLFGRFERYAISRTYWAFPNIVHSRTLHGWETDIHPLLYLGRHKDASHTVLPPLFWDFASKKGRTTIGFPAYWRFADSEGRTVTQVAANTLYREKPAAGGTDWQFHLLPLVSFGHHPKGTWWNLLFGLAGYDHDAGTTKVKAFWIPITVSESAAQKAAAARATSLSGR